MPADRHPEAPRISAGLATHAVGGPVGDGESMSAVDRSGLACADLHLDGVACTEVVLRDADFTGSALVDAAFRDAVFENPMLANATFRGGSFTRVLVDGGRLTGLQVAETEIRDVLWSGCSADLATFRHARLAYVTFQECSLREADFMGLRGEWVRFHDCDLRGAGFQHAEFAHSEFRRCRMEGIDGVEGLRGTAMELDQLVTLAPALARALGVGVVGE
jgi:uncharacterized protein YjbI with pentapeptide repeats